VVKKIGRATKPDECEVRVRFAVRDDGAREFAYSTRFVLIYRNQFGFPVLTGTDLELARMFLKRPIARPLVAEMDAPSGPPG
jgi:hypothetical protein